MITIDVWLDSAVTGKRTRLGEACIYNDGKSPQHPRRGDYNCHFKGKRKMFEVEVKGFPRLSRNVWDLIRRALDEAAWHNKI